ncbi:MAG: hypothetical protein WC810_26820 [Janthinobacterium sp.]|jgi:hypothetical protein
MSKLFFDHLLELKEIDKQIKKVAKTTAEREELWGLVDEIVHHKVMGCILDKLPRDNHDEFLHMFHESPHDSKLLFEYLRIKAGEDLESLVKKEIEVLSRELIGNLKLS